MQRAVAVQAELLVVGDTAEGVQPGSSTNQPAVSYVVCCAPLVARAATVAAPTIPPPWTMTRGVVITCRRLCGMRSSSPPARPGTRRSLRRAPPAAYLPHRGGYWSTPRSRDRREYTDSRTRAGTGWQGRPKRSEEHTSELQSRGHLV